jgi:response regulator RpfG family c-di-GMP phosphodiesterase
MAKLKRAVGPAPSDIAVLLVDDSPLFLDSLSALLASADMRILTARSGLHALELLQQEPVSVVVADYYMPGMDGVTLLGEVARLFPGVGRVLMTGMPDADIVLEARGHRVLVKGMDPNLILRVIQREVRKSYG